MEQPRSTPREQPDASHRPTPCPPDGSREQRGRFLAEKAGLVALGQVIGYLLRRLFE